MIKLRNALMAGAMAASALIIPVTMQIQPAGADAATVTGTTSPALPSFEKPCRKHKNPARCRERRGSGGGGGGGHGVGGGISDDSITGGGSGRGVDN